MDLLCQEQAVKLERVLTRLADGAREIAPADAAVVHLFDEEGACFVTATSGLANPSGQPEQLAVGDGFLDREALSGRTTVIADAHADPRAANVSGDYRSLLCLPLVHEDIPIGALHLYAMAPQRFDQQDVARLSPLADLGATAVGAIRAQEALKALEAGKSQFIRVATHELRSPVAVAQSLVRGVLKGYAGPMTDKQAELLGRISRRLDFLESLVNDLLDLAAGKAPDLAEEETAVALSASVGWAALQIQPRAEEKGVSLMYRVHPEELLVRGANAGLDRIFINLVGNAVKYTPTGGRVTVSMRRVGDEIEVTVADTGIGIPEEALPHLFEEFYRAPNAKASDETGTGLGLAIVKDLVDRYGGRTAVGRGGGQGATLPVAFPALVLAR
jgi:signal transduction histidine kinase